MGWVNSTERGDEGLLSGMKYTQPVDRSMYVWMGSIHELHAIHSMSKLRIISFVLNFVFTNEKYISINSSELLSKKKNFSFVYFSCFDCEQ